MSVSSAGRMLLEALDAQLSRTMNLAYDETCLSVRLASLMPHALAK